MAQSTATVNVIMHIKEFGTMKGRERLTVRCLVKKRKERNACRREATANKFSVREQSTSTSEPLGFGRLATIGQCPWYLPEALSCTHCKAVRFYRETPGFCCSSGQVSLFPINIPDELRDLFFGSSQISLHFRANVRTYNNAFAFTSFGVTYDRDLCRNDKNVYTFKVQGMVYHFLNDLIPIEGKGKNLQLYFYDVHNELANRLAVSDKLNEELVVMILKLLEVNPYSSFFRNLRERSALHECKIVLRSDPGLDQNRCNVPTAEQVVAIWKDGDEPDQSQPRDIRVYTKLDRSQKVEYYYGCYDPLQYVLLFPRGEPGWHVGIERKTPSSILDTTRKAQSCGGQHSAHPSHVTSGAQLLQAEAKVLIKDKTLKSHSCC